MNKRIYRLPAFFDLCFDLRYVYLTMRNGQSNVSVIILLNRNKYRGRMDRWLLLGYNEV
jgi:hypothetical protein